MFDTQSKPYKAWQKYGAAVEAAKPRGLVVVSAHWENEDGSEHVKGGLERYQREEPEVYTLPLTRRSQHRHDQPLGL